MRILITGADGFLCNHLIAKLDPQLDLILLNRNGSKVNSSSACGSGTDIV